MSARAAGFRVRAALPGDMAAVVALERGSEGAPHWGEAVYAAMLQNGEGDLERQEGGLRRRLMVAEDAGGAVIGFAVGRVLRIGDVVESELESVTVSLAARRRGVGRAVCEAVMAWASEQGAAAMELEVRASSAEAIALYEAMGFGVSGRRTEYYRHPTEDARLMSRKLL